MHVIPRKLARCVRCMAQCTRVSVAAMEHFEIDVVLRNESDEAIEGDPQHPLHLSYHWINSEAEIVVFDGLRTILETQLGPRVEIRQRMWVQAPDGSAATLRVSLVQEGQFWFDLVAPESACDLSVEIRSAPAWSDDAPAHAFAGRHDLNKAHFAPYIRHAGRSRPLMLIVETTNICNHHCIICAYDVQSRKKQRMSGDTFAEAVRQYLDLGGGILSLTPMVGDIFLDKSLRDRLDFLRPYRPHGITRLSVTTNAGYAKLYDDAELTELIDEFDNINISIYGLDEEEFEAMTKTRGYADMRAGVDRILRFSRANIVLGFRCLEERSTETILQWVQTLPSYEAARARVTIGGNVWQFANWGVLDTSLPLPFGASWAPTADDEKRQCGIPLLALQVFSNGNVSFCPGGDFDNHDSLQLGNIMTATLAEMFNGPKARRLWDWASHGTPAFCRTCSFHRPLSDMIATPGLIANPLLVVGS